jgi:hypothetical protein
MNQVTVQQEILLIKDSSLSRRTFVDVGPNPYGRPMTTSEQLEEYCWNGMLEAFVPGLVDCCAPCGKKLFLWQVVQAQSFLHIDLCLQPLSVSRCHSVDPYLFMKELILN